MARPKHALTEWGAIDVLQAALARAGQGRGKGVATKTVLGIGDDAAILSASGARRLVWTIDGAVEHVHFERAWISLSDIAYKATNAAVSDIAAMGARPVAALCHLVLPRGTKKLDIAAIGRGQAAAARALSCPVIGGNISSGDSLELVTTVLGEWEPASGVRSGAAPLTRDGARVGDELWLFGDVGLAAAGCQVLSKGLPRTGSAAPCVAAWRRPRALVEEGQALRGRASACLDVSDGLVSDARHLAEASEVKVVFEQSALTGVFAAALEKTALRLGRTALELALYGGEDYALLASGPRARRPRSARVIGRIERGQGVWLADARERREVTGGFEHLARR